MATLKANGRCMAEFVVKRTDTDPERCEVGNPTVVVTYRLMESNKILSKYEYVGGKYPHKIPFKVYGKVPKGTTTAKFMDLMHRLASNRAANEMGFSHEILKEEVYHEIK